MLKELTGVAVAARRSFVEMAGMQVLEIAGQLDRQAGRLGQVLARSRLQIAPRDVGLEASMLPAAAQAPVWHHPLDVAEFARQVGGPDVQLAVADDARADARADETEEHV